MQRDADVRDQGLVRGMSEVCVGEHCCVEGLLAICPVWVLYACCIRGFNVRINILPGAGVVARFGVMPVVGESL
ncbi:hypothetical protein [Paenibacillus sp. TSA_86.1]|uniref:hypothetical protein n=1 Tax=Paenibacillus sp. TSA_86.1 TaxID=3415649 RepID=UPI0040458309